MTDTTRTIEKFDQVQRAPGVKDEMKVISINGDRILCEWFDGSGKLTHREFNRSQLVLVRKYTKT